MKELHTRRQTPVSNFGVLTAKKMLRLLPLNLGLITDIPKGLVGASMMLIAFTLSLGLIEEATNDHFVRFRHRVGNDDLRIGAVNPQ